MPSFKYDFTVSWVETDALAVVHFSNFFRYFERAEQEFYILHGMTQENSMMAHGIAFPRVEAHCTYESPLRFGDRAETELSLEEMADKSVKIRFEIRNLTEKKRAAHGSMTLVCVDTQKWKARSIPDDVRTLFRNLA